MPKQRLPKQRFEIRPGPNGRPAVVSRKTGRWLIAQPSGIYIAGNRKNDYRSVCRNEAIDSFGVAAVTMAERLAAIAQPIQSPNYAGVGDKKPVPRKPTKPKTETNHDLNTANSAGKSDPPSRLWSRNETDILVTIYFTNSFSAGDDSRPECHTIAGAFHRTPSSIDRQWRNIATVLRGDTTGIGSNLRDSISAYMDNPRKVKQWSARLVVEKYPTLDNLLRDTLR